MKTVKDGLNKRLGMREIRISEDRSPGSKVRPRRPIGQRESEKSPWSILDEVHTEMKEGWGREQLQELKNTPMKQIKIQFLFHKR